VFGRLAGRRAAKTHLATSQPALTKDAWTPLFLRQKQLVSGCTWIFSFDLPSPKQYAGTHYFIIIIIIIKPYA